MCFVDLTSLPISVQEIDRPPVRAPRFYDSWVSAWLRDARDLAFIDLMLLCTFLVLPLGIFLIANRSASLWLLVPYYAALGFFLGPFTLMLHNTCHRPLFKKKYHWLNHYIPWILCPFFGQSPETYYGHHIGMHHPENNLDDDLSSTMRYRRDSFRDFMEYFGRFFVLGVVQLPLYFFKRGRRKLGFSSLFGELSFYLLLGLLLIWNWPATLLVFLAPFCVTRFMMMNGNWAQHAFVDLRAPADSYRNSITCINSTYNRRCFNDGYHIAHHIKPTMHFSEVPQHLKTQLDEYRRADAVIFEKLDYFMIWILLMFKRYDVLARHFVDLNPAKRSSEEIVSLLRSRVQAQV